MHGVPKIAYEMSYNLSLYL